MLPKHSACKIKYQSKSQLGDQEEENCNFVTLGPRADFLAF